MLAEASERTHKRRYAGLLSRPAHADDAVPMAPDAHGVLPPASATERFLVTLAAAEVAQVGRQERAALGASGASGIAILEHDVGGRPPATRRRR